MSESKSKLEIELKKAIFDKIQAEEDLETYLLKYQNSENSLR